MERANLPDVVELITDPRWTPWEVYVRGHHYEDTEDGDLTLEAAGSDWGRS